MKVTIVSGARPNFMKIAPLCRAIDAARQAGKNISYRIVYTGPEDDESLDASLFSDLDMQTGEKNDFGGIYVGEGKLIYSPYPGEKVKFADINSAYWKNSFCCAVSVC